MSQLDTQIPIRAATRADAPAIAAILAEAFARDPVMSWTLGGEGRSQALFLALATRVYLKRGFGHIAEDAGATLWLPAGADVRLPLSDELGVLLSVLRSGGVGALARVRKTADAMQTRRPKEPHYYLFAVGARDGARGKGLGGRLIREGLARADAAEAAAYLENSNPRNTPLYERLGFMTSGDIPLPSEAPPLLAMLRSAGGAL